MKYINKKLLLVILAFVFFTFGCSDDENPTTPEPEKANVMVIHASPDAPGVDLLVDNSIAGNGLTFPNNTPYLSVEKGNRNIKVNVAGTSTTVIEESLNLDANKNYSIFAVGAVANLTPLVLEDDLTTPANGKSHVRFLHLSPDAPSVDITTQEGIVIFGNISFKEFTPFTPINSGTYNLQVRLAGTETVVLDLNNIQAESGKIYTVFAKGFVVGSGDQSIGAQIIVNK